jgi:type IV pilus assembly protein PilV
MRTRPPLPRRFARVRRQTQRGVALLEALLAILILAVGLLGTIGLQARAYAALSDASMRAEATIATERLLGLMNSDQANLGQYALALAATPSDRLAVWYADTVAAVPGASIVITVTPLAGSTRNAVVATISWTRKAGGPTNKHAVTAYIAAST